MKRKHESIAIAVIIVLVVAVTGIASYDLLSPHQTHSQSTTDSFVEQPVVDVILPTLLRQQGGNTENAVLNLTRGENTSLTVNVYTTINITLKFQYEDFLLASSSESSNSSQNSSSFMVASFDPSTLTVDTGAKGVGTLYLTVSSLALPGQYSAVVSAVNINNSTQTWGDIFQINVT